MSRNDEKMFRPEDPFNVPLEDARIEFLNCYAEYRCELVTGLLGLPLEELQSGRHLGSPDYWSMISLSGAYPLLSNALAEWAGKFGLRWQGEPAGWAMSFSINSLYPPQHVDKFKFRAPFTLHEVYPSSEPDLVSVRTGLPEPDIASFLIAIASWDRPGGESKSAFRKRSRAACRQEIERHIEEIEKQNWTSRERIVRREYIRGLAMRMSGSSLSDIQEAFAKQGFHVGRRGGAERDVAALKRGIDNVANFIQLDPRP
jgi:hypothetical protein